MTHKLTIVYIGLCKDVCLLLIFQCVWVQSENSPHFKWNKKETLKGWCRKSWKVDQPYWMDSIKWCCIAPQGGHAIPNMFVDSHLSCTPTSYKLHCRKGKAISFIEEYTYFFHPFFFPFSFLFLARKNEQLLYLLYKQICGWAIDLENWLSGCQTINGKHARSHEYRGGGRRRKTSEQYFLRESKSQEE